MNGHGADATVGDAERWARRVGSLTADDLPRLLGPTDHAIALMLARWYAGAIHTSPQYGVRAWNGLIWEDDAVHGRLRAAAMETVQLLLAAADVIPIPVAVLAEAAARARGPQGSLEAAEAALRRRMRAQLTKWEFARNLNAVLDLATKRKPFLETIASFDRDPMALTVANGVLDLRTGTLAPARAERRLTKALDVAYDPAAPCPRFERFLAEIFPTDTADLARFLQRFVGLCLTGLVTEHILPIFHGDGRNGKTTLLRVLLALLGPFAQVAPLSLLLEGRHGRPSIPNDVARLAAVRFVVTSETPEHARLAEATIKTLTGGDRLNGRFLNHEFFDFDPTHKVLLVTNHKPTVRGRDHAIWSRIALVPFTVKFWKPEDDPPPGAPLADPDLGETLLTELPGVLRWAVEGCLAYQQHGLVRPEVVRAATEEYRVEQDALGPFLDECCVLDHAAWTLADPLYSRYVDWAKGTNEHVLTKKAFGMELGKRGFQAVKERGQRGRTGLRLRSGPDE
jgi:putative DNA primase/helicase